jgi:deazaflavin-dependent oxidoreductase (nitroreductase family)
VKRRIVILLQRHIVNPLSRRLVLAGRLRHTALIETRGRRTGQPRITPVGNGLSDDAATFWIVAEHGMHASYVRNLEAEPKVRILVDGHWRNGYAHILVDDDPRERLVLIGNTTNSSAVRAMGTELLTVRVDLDPEA